MRKAGSGAAGSSRGRAPRDPEVEGVFERRNPLAQAGRLLVALSELAGLVVDLPDDKAPPPLVTSTTPMRPPRVRKGDLAKGALIGGRKAVSAGGRRVARSRLGPACAGPSARREPLRSAGRLRAGPAVEGRFRTAPMRGHTLLAVPEAARAVLQPAAAEDIWFFAQELRNNWQRRAFDPHRALELQALLRLRLELAGHGFVPLHRLTLDLLLGRGQLRKARPKLKNMTNHRNMAPARVARGSAGWRRTWARSATARSARSAAAVAPLR